MWLKVKQGHVLTREYPKGLILRLLNLKENLLLIQIEFGSQSNTVTVTQVLMSGYPFHFA